jgi:TonB family protein
VVRDQGPRRPTLSPEEIRGLLEMGARPGDHTSIPGEEQMCLELIRRRLYDAWTQPSSAEAAGATAEVRLRLLPGGVLGERAMVRGSGNPAVDASVMEAVNAVRSVQGLTTEFLRRHETVVIAFRVE